MALLKLQFKPGINRDVTNYSGEGGWWECDKVRFRSGFPEKIGGWVKYSPNYFFGVCRNLFSWVTTFSDLLLAAGTNKKFYIELGGRYNDVTPIRATLNAPDTNNSLSVVLGSGVVTVVTGIPHGALTGDFVTISGVVGSVGGVLLAEINANHEVTVFTATSFTFTVATAATSTVSSTGGTAISMAFEVHVGNSELVFGYGWGVGLWSGLQAWGNSANVPVVLPQRDWWFDSFDNDLFANIREGAPYIWQRGLTYDPTSSLSTRAITLQAYAASEGYVANDVPAVVTQLMVSQQDRHLIAFGAVPYGSTPDAFDPLLIRWADQDTPGDWTPQVTNTAGFLRASRGSRIVTALPTRQEILVWTDITLYALQFLGTTDVFGLQEYAPDITIAGPRARISASSVVYWMGRNKFYMYSGRVDTLNCTLLSHVFDNLNYNQLEQIIAGTNEQWNEIWWFYPSANSNQNDSYVIYNYVEKIWYYGMMPRTAWMDSQLYTGPLASNTDTYSSTAADGLIYSHETGVNDDVLPMESYIQSNDFDLGDGDKFMLARRVIPDIKFDLSTMQNPSALFTVQSRNFPGNAYRFDAQDARLVTETAVDQFTEQVFIRARARQMSLKVSSSEFGVHWNLGTPRLDVREDGTR